MDTANTPVSMLAHNAATDAKPGGLQAVAPDVNPGDPNPLISLGFTPEFIGQLWEMVEQGTKYVEKQGEKWKILLAEYIPKVSKTGDAETVTTGSHFRNVQTKMGQLFLSTPEIRCTERPVGPGANTKPGPMGLPVMMSDVIAVKQTVLNERLGPDGIKASRLMDEVLFDMLAWSGVGCTKLGHTIVIKNVQQPVMGPDPNFIPPQPDMTGLGPTPQPPQVPQMGPDGQPLMQTVPVPIYEKTYWRRFSPLKWIPDVRCTSSRYDEDAAFQGFWSSMLPWQAKLAFKLTDSDVGNGGKDTKVYDHGDKDSGQADVVEVAELFIKACSLDPSIVYPQAPDTVCHPDQLFQLVLLKGKRDAPIVWRPCVDQTFDEQGQLTPDSIDRFPIRVFTLRDLADSSAPPSDAAHTNAMVKTRNTIRRLGIAFMQSAIQKILYDTEQFEEGEITKLENSSAGAYVGLKGGALAEGVEHLLAGTPTPRVSPDTYRLDESVAHEMNEMIGVDANSAGATNDVVRAATEVATVQQGAAGRSEKERNRVLGDFLDGVRLIDILIARYTTEAQYASIVGQEGAARVQEWDGQMVSGRWLYEVAPDSQVHLDSAAERQLQLTFYNMVAKDPLVDRTVVLKKLARLFGFDPAKIVINPQQMMGQPQLGGGQPGAPGPQGPPGQPAHGGPANKHQASNSGGMQNAPGAPNHRDQQQQMEQGPQPGLH